MTEENIAQKKSIETFRLMLEKLPGHIVLDVAAVTLALFKREVFPERTSDDYAKEFLNTLERIYCVKFEKSKSETKENND